MVPCGNLTLQWKMDNLHFSLHFLLKKYGASGCYIINYPYFHLNKQYLNIIKPLVKPMNCSSFASIWGSMTPLQLSFQKRRDPYLRPARQGWWTAAPDLYHEDTQPIVMAWFSWGFSLVVTDTSHLVPVGSTSR